MTEQVLIYQYLFTNLVRVRPGRKRSADQPWSQLAPVLGRRLRQARETRNTTREKLGSDAGVAPSTIAKLESGRVAEPGLFTVWAICKALHLGVEGLLNDLEHNDAASGVGRPDATDEPLSGT